MPKKTHGNILAVCGVVQPSEAMVGLLPGAESSSGLGHLPLGVFQDMTPQGMCSLRMQSLEKNNKNHRYQVTSEDKIYLKMICVSNFSIAAFLTFFASSTNRKTIGHV